MTTPINPAEIRTICAHLGITAARPLTREEIRVASCLETKREKAQSTIHICDCGRIAVHRFGGWECERCMRARKAYEGTQRAFMSVHNVLCHTTTRELNERQLKAA